MRVVFCSCPKNHASDLAKIAIQNRMAACVQIIPHIDSYYWWKDEICSDQESLLLFKTDVTMVEDLTNLLKTHHPYEVPEIISVPIMSEGNFDYLKWLQNEVSCKKA
jgi:periplasmic divalent cation tolerance protein